MTVNDLIHYLNHPVYHNLEVVVAIREPELPVRYATLDANQTPRTLTTVGQTYVVLETKVPPE